MNYRQVHGLIRPPYRPLQHAVNPSMGLDENILFSTVAYADMVGFDGIK